MLKQSTDSLIIRSILQYNQDFFLGEGRIKCRRHGDSLQKFKSNICFAVLPDI